MMSFVWDRIYIYRIWAIKHFSQTKKNMYSNCDILIVLETKGFRVP